jgi:hypothetical protein
MASSIAQVASSDRAREPIDRHADDVRELGRRLSCGLKSDLQVPVRIPLDQVAGGSDGDDDSGPAGWAESSTDVLGDRLGGALREVEAALSTFAEDTPQESAGLLDAG